MSQIKENITETIKEFRSRMDMSQEELSKMCGYSSTYIGKIERGQRSPSLDTLIRIAEALQIPVSSFFDPFYRKQNQLKNDWNPNNFSPYDATLRRFNYLFGRLEIDGKVKQIFHLPWSSSNIPDNNTNHNFTDLPFINFSSQVSKTILILIEKSAQGETKHLSLNIAGFDVLEETTDLVFQPHPRDDDQANEIRFELFYPRVVREAEPVPLNELQFELVK